jgi:endo-1,4-beta-D-glucanase Y
MSSALWANLIWVGVVTAEPPPDRLLRCSWADYRRTFIQSDGRVIDPAGGDITTSEGQAYGMIRAVWIDDRRRFDSMRIWTRDNLQSGDDDRLPAWKWGEQEDGSWGVLDTNPASDADQWMAYALFLAADEWGEPDYRRQALGLIDAIWEEETQLLGERRYLLPGPWAKTEAESGPLRLNPSYFLPFAWRVFAQEDLDHDWMGLVDDHYALLDEVMSAGHLPPDWLFLDPVTGAPVVPPPFMPEAHLFGYEAWRMAWTLAAEVAWHDESRALRLLGPFGALETEWRRLGQIYSRLLPDGSPASDHEYLGLYGALLPAWSLVRPDDADALYLRHIEPARARHGWGDREDYYSNNWVWLGLALWTGRAESGGVP